MAVLAAIAAAVVIASKESADGSAGGAMWSISAMPSNPACSAALARSMMVPNDIRICGRYSQNSGTAPDVMMRSFALTGTCGCARPLVSR